MTITLPPNMPLRMRVLVEWLHDDDNASMLESQWHANVVRLLSELAAEVCRERIPSGDAPPDDPHARKLGEGLTWELANACGYLGEDGDPSWGVLIAALRAGFCQGAKRAPLTWVEPAKGGDAPPDKCKGCDGHGSYPEVDRYDGHTEDFTCPDCNGTGKGGDAPMSAEQLEARTWGRPPGGAEPGLRKAVKRVEAELRHHEGSRVPAGYAANLVSEALQASEGAAHPQPTPDAMTLGASAIISAWIESGEPVDAKGRAIIEFDIGEVLAQYAPPSETDPEGWRDYVGSIAGSMDSDARALPEGEGKLALQDYSDRLTLICGGDTTVPTSARHPWTTEPPATDPGVVTELIVDIETSFEPSQTPDAPGLWLRVTELGGQVHEYAEDVYEHDGELVYESPESGGVIYRQPTEDALWLGKLVLEGGRATRGAQADDGLRKRVEELTKLVERAASDADLDSNDHERGATAAYVDIARRLRAALEVQS